MSVYPVDDQSLEDAVPVSVVTAPKFDGLEEYVFTCFERMYRLSRPSDTWSIRRRIV